MKLKLNLLIDVLNNNPSPKKYTQAYLNLKNVIDLELKESKTKNKVILNNDILNDFSEIQKLYSSFKAGLPLMVIEKYFNANSDDLNRYIYLNYQDKELTDIKVIDLYMLLEEYYNLCFNIAVKIADLYNLEIRINEDKTNNTKENSYF